MFMFNIKMEIHTPKIWKQMIKYTSNITYKARVEIRKKNYLVHYVLENIFTTFWKIKPDFWMTIIDFISGTT